MTTAVETLNGEVIERVPASNLARVERGPSALAIPADKLDLLKRTICQGSTDDEFEMFVGVCRRTGLDPFARQIFAVKRWDNVNRRETMAIQVSIDGFRLIADRSGKYAGQLGPQWCGPDGQWHDVWLKDTPPSAARVGVLRSDFKEPVWGIARWSEYAQFKRDGGLTAMWHRMGTNMLAKCAESLGLRKAFPQELGGVYTSDEMSQAEAPEGDDEKSAAKAAKKAQSPKANAAPVTTGPTLGQGFKANIEPRLTKLGKTFANVRSAIEKAGEADKVANDDPAKWDASLAEGIERWVSAAEGKRPKRDDSEIADLPEAQPTTAAPATNEPRKPWPKVDRASPAKACYWRAKLEGAASKALAETTNKMLKGESASELVDSFENENRIPEFAEGVLESVAVTAYRAAWAKIENDPKFDWSPYAIPF